MTRGRWRRVVAESKRLRLGLRVGLSGGRICDQNGIGAVRPAGTPTNVGYDRGETKRAPAAWLRSPRICGPCGGHLDCDRRSPQSPKPWGNQFAVPEQCFSRDGLFGYGELRHCLLMIDSGRSSLQIWLLQQAFVIWLTSSAHVHSARCQGASHLGPIARAVSYRPQRDLNRSNTTPTRIMR